MRSAAALLAAALLAGCARDDGGPPPLKVAVKAPMLEDTGRFVPEAIGAPFDGYPWISHVTIADLDGSGRLGILATDDRLNAVVWLRPLGGGEFRESVLMDHLPAPVHVEAVDMYGSGHKDLVVACMGEVFPNNDKIGSIVIGENDGHQHFKRHVILDHVARVTDVQVGDLAGEGRRDLAVAQFGYEQGEIRWMKNLGNWRFESHNLLNLSGTINVCIADMTGHGHNDIVAVVSKQWEEIYLFANDGSGNFTKKVVFGSTNEDFGSSGISLCDLNHDGRPDILYTNGDGFRYADPGTRPWHGVQWLENLGDGNFKYHRIGDLPGAYAPIGVSIDGDGIMDIVVVSGFNDWSDPSAVSLVLYKNDGHQNFTAHVLGRHPTHLITCQAGDLDGSGRPSIVTGAYYAYPPFEDHPGRITLWRPASRP